MNIPVELVGDCVGVREGGRVDFVSRDIEVEILPRDIFDKFVLDISDLEIGEHLKVADLAGQLPEDAKFLDDENRVVVVIEVPRAVEEEEEEEEAEEALETEERLRSRKSSARARATRNRSPSRLRPLGPVCLGQIDDCRSGPRFGQPRGGVRARPATMSVSTSWLRSCGGGVAGGGSLARSVNWP